MGTANRHMGATSMNRESSRSHAVFNLSIRSVTTNAETQVKQNRFSKFSLVDLAGRLVACFCNGWCVLTCMLARNSERQKDTNATGERLKEAGQINKSLSALGNVIKALSDRGSNIGSSNHHIQYRDSKLTFLLRDSLGGNSKVITLLIVGSTNYLSCHNY